MQYKDVYMDVWQYHSLHEILAILSNGICAVVKGLNYVSNVP